MKAAETDALEKKDADRAQWAGYALAAVGLLVVVVLLVLDRWQGAAVGAALVFAGTKLVSVVVDNIHPPAPPATIVNHNTAKPAARGP